MANTSGTGKLDKIRQITTLDHYSNKFTSCGNTPSTITAALGTGGISVVFPNGGIAIGDHKQFRNQ